ncbi:14443_t:CDS:2 [Ambispora leptoticha]|uniref:Protein transport protein SFT2 n=1 Tax=Ambispora leptoticha TaxID=144679 RepID=A0A9N9B2P0_9GLOM|nr:14443_t:CDS:2 [Ambispora leptoticha]
MPTEQQFRDTLNSLGWGSNNTRGSGIRLPTNNNNSTPFSRLTENTSSFFGSVSNRVQGYIPLTNNQEEESLFTLNRWQRLTGFGILLMAGALCFLIAFLTIPILPINPRKFAVTYTMGSLLVLASFSMLKGPVEYLKHIFSMERLAFTLAYLGSMIATLYVVSYFPGGANTLQMGTRMFANQATNILPF